MQFSGGLFSNIFGSDHSFYPFWSKFKFSQFFQLSMSISAKPRSDVTLDLPFLDVSDNKLSIDTPFFQHFFGHCPPGPKNRFQLRKINKMKNFRFSKFFFLIPKNYVQVTTYQNFTQKCPKMAELWPFLHVKNGPILDPQKSPILEKWPWRPYPLTQNQTLWYFFMFKGWGQVGGSGWSGSQNHDSIH